LERITSALKQGAVRKGKAGAQRQGDWLEVMARLGIAPSRVPETVRLLRDYPSDVDGPNQEADWLYRAMSAYTHGFQWSSMLSEQGAEVHEAAFGTRRVVTMMANEQLALTAAAYCVSAFRDATYALASYSQSDAAAYLEAAPVPR
jgi:hypothetical protein